MHKLIVFILATFLSQGVAFGGGLSASFQGVPNSPCDVTCDQYSVACYDGETDGSGNLLDKSGANLLDDNIDYSDWSKTRASINCSYLGPFPGETGCAITEDSTAASSHHIYNATSVTSGNTYKYITYAKAITRNWAQFGDLSGNLYVTFNLKTRKFYSTTGSLVTNYGYGPCFGGYCRVWLEWVEDTTRSRNISIRLLEDETTASFDGSGQDSIVVYGTTVYQVDGTHPERGILITDGTDKPWHDLAPTNAPGYVQGDFQRQDGNRITGRDFTNASTQYYFKADHDSLDIFSDDNTVTAAYVTKAGAPATQGIIAKGNFQNAGMYIFDNTGTNEITARYNKTGATADAKISVTNTDDGLIKIVQQIRRDNVAVFCKDGTCGTPVSVTGYGGNFGAGFYVGSLNVGANPSDAEIYFIHLQRRALSPHELSSQREQLLGILSSQKTLGATNVIVDGDMEAAGVGAYSTSNGAVLSKVTTSIHGGKQSLRVTYNGTSNPNAYQILLTPGVTYRATGWGSGDGTAVPRSLFQSVGGWLWTGTSSTDWQHFDVTFVASGTPLYLGCSSSSASYCQFDDVYVYEYDDSQWTFSRTTDAFQTFSTGTISEIAEEIPRVGGKGGGLLIEGQSTNIEIESHDFTSWDTPVRSSIPSCASPSPELNSDRACIFHEDNTAANNHYIYHNIVGSQGAGEYTFSLYAKAINRDWIRVDVRNQAGTFNGGTHFGLSTGTIGSSITAGGITVDNTKIEPLDNGWYRIQISVTTPSSDTLRLFVFIAEANSDTNFDGLDQDSLYIYGAQFEASSFASSLIETDGASVTRTADDMTIDPHPAVGRRVLPEEFDEEGVLTVEFDAKCLWSGSSDIGETRVLFEIGGNTGTATNTRNRINIPIDLGGRAYINFRDDSGVLHRGQSGIDPVDFSAWHTYKARIDFSDLSRLQIWIDGSVPAGMSYTANSGTGVFDTSDTLIRLGNDFFGTVDSFCKYRNLRIAPREW